MIERLWGLKKIPDDAALEKMKASVMARYPHWKGMPLPDEAFEPVYMLNRCGVCRAPRWEHIRGQKRHLIPYGGTG